MTCAVLTRSALIGLVLLAGLPATARAELLVSEALSRAAERDPTFLAAQAQKRAEAEKGVQERSTLRPQVAVLAGGEYRYADSQFAFGSAQDQYSAWSVSLEARQPVLRLDWQARLDRAEAQDTLAVVRYRQAEVEFLSRVAQRYLDALRAQDQLLQVEAEVQAVAEALADTRKRYEVELVPGTDLKEAQARDDLTRAQRIAAQARLAETRDALAEITGYDGPLPTLREELVLPRPPAESLEAWFAAARERNALLLAARLQRDIALADVASRRADGLPQVDLVAGASHADSREYELGQLQDDARVGVELSVPIYAGGFNQSRLREAGAALEAAEQDVRRLELETEREVRRAYRDVESAAASAQAYTQVLVSAEAAEAAVRAGYDAGTRTIRDVLDARSQLVQARRQRNEARYDLLIKGLYLRAITGLLTAEEVLALDALLVRQPS